LKNILPYGLAVPGAEQSPVLNAFSKRLRYNSTPWGICQIFFHNSREDVGRDTGLTEIDMERADMTISTKIDVKMGAHNDFLCKWIRIRKHFLQKFYSLPDKMTCILRKEVVKSKNRLAKGVVCPFLGNTSFLEDKNSLIYGL
jgi:hypothetical protein